jgi:hypothetical protein
MPASARQLDLLAARLPAGADYVTPKELAAASGFSVQFILDSYDSGRVLGLQAAGKPTKGKECRRHTRIPRECALLWLAAHANFSDEEFAEQLRSIIDRLPRALLRDVITHATHRLNR